MQLDPNTPWFVAQLKPQGLRRALEHLGRQKHATFSPFFITTRLGSKVSSSKQTPLFPGYLFVSFDPDKIGWTAINSTRGIARLISHDPRRPTPLPPQLILGLMARCDETGQVLPPAKLSIGDRIRIISGPFADTVTEIENLPDGQRIGILMDVMGRQVKTSLPRHQIEKLD